MPVLDATDQSDFLRRQVLTSRNLRSGRLTDVALGGPNYQIEHHLFPSMPGPNLRRSQALIEAFCQQRGVPYCRILLPVPERVSGDGRRAAVGDVRRLTDTMVAGFDVIDFLHVLTDRSVQLLDAPAAGLLLADPPGALRVVAASSEAARLLDRSG